MPKCLFELVQDNDILLYIRIAVRNHNAVVKGISAKFSDDTITGAQTQASQGPQRSVHALAGFEKELLARADACARCAIISKLSLEKKYLRKAHHSRTQYVEASYAKATSMQASKRAIY